MQLFESACGNIVSRRVDNWKETFLPCDFPEFGLCGVGINAGLADGDDVQEELIEDRKGQPPYQASDDQARIRLATPITKCSNAKEPLKHTYLRISEEAEAGCVRYSNSRL